MSIAVCLFNIMLQGQSFPLYLYKVIMCGLDAFLPANNEYSSVIGPNVFTLGDWPIRGERVLHMWESDPLLTPGSCNVGHVSLQYWTTLPREPVFRLCGSSALPLNMAVCFVGFAFCQNDPTLRKDGSLVYVLKIVSLCHRETISLSMKVLLIPYLFRKNVCFISVLWTLCLPRFEGNKRTSVCNVFRCVLIHSTFTSACWPLPLPDSLNAHRIHLWSELIELIKLIC